MCLAATKFKYIFDIETEGTANYRKNEKITRCKIALICGPIFRSVCLRLLHQYL